MQTHDFLTLKEMADILKVKPSWLYSRNRETGPGTIPRIKIGKYIRYEPDKVMEWIKEQNGSVGN
jgi:predicted DNA-binding transcriptional regulator AlpA